MKHLTQFIKQQNVFRGIFEQTPITLPLNESDTKDIIGALESKLSPENLHCDGEISTAEAAKVARFLHKVTDELSTHLDTPITLNY